MINESEDMFKNILGEFLNDDVQIDHAFIKRFLVPLKLMLSASTDLRQVY